MKRIESVEIINPSYLQQLTLQYLNVPNDQEDLFLANFKTREVNLMSDHYLERL